MSLFKRKKWYWMDDFINGVRYRLPLKTTNWQEANRLEKEKLAEIAAGKLGSQGKVARQTFNTATDAYIEERKLHTAEKTRCTDQERSRALRKFFGETPLRRISAEKIVDYQVVRNKAGVSGRTINMEVGLLRRVLKKYKQWGRLADSVKMLPERPTEARVLASEEKARLLRICRHETRLADCLPLQRS